MNTSIIRGKINSINQDETVVSIIMNDKTVDVLGKLTQEGEKVSMKVSIDMNDFDGAEAISSLNEACAELHTDADGESKLWPTVDIVINTVLKSSCK